VTSRGAEVRGAGDTSGGDLSPALLPRVLIVWTSDAPSRSRPARQPSAVVRAVALVIGLLASAASPPRAVADPEFIFGQGTWILALEAGAGSQVGQDDRSNVAFVSLAPRLSILPFDPFGPDWLRGNVDVGLEGWFQHYTHPSRTLAAGLKLAARYYLLRWGHWVPYAEVTAGVGGTSLNVKEIDSNFTFVLEGGAGVAYMVDRQAVSVGVRFFHVSNGDLATPNTGVNALAGRLGISVFFP
jgi:Lipid A 3-O-deacylase (PagL)